MSASNTFDLLNLLGPTFDELATRDPIMFEAFLQLGLGQVSQQQQISTGFANVTALAGGKIVTADYSATGADDGTLIVMNGAEALNFTLPAKPPSASWKILVKNVASASVSVKPNGPKLNGATSPISLATNAWTYIATDGTDYYAT